MRQRRDYRVPSVAALLRAAEAARRDAARRTTRSGPVETVGEAVLELLQAGDGSLGALDVPELEPLDGVRDGQRGRRARWTWRRTRRTTAPGPFTAGTDDRLVGRLDEHPFLPSELDDEESRPAGPQ